VVAVAGRAGDARARLAAVAHGTEGAVVAGGAVRLGRVRARAAGADVGRAAVAVVGTGAGPVHVRAAGDRVAAVGGAHVAVVAAGADVRRVDTAGGRVARVVRALVVVVAVGRRARLAGAERVARVADRARVVVGAGGPVRQVRMIARVGALVAGIR